MVQPYSLPRGLKPFVLWSFNAALKRCSTQKLVPKALLGKERIPPVGRNDKLLLLRIPLIGRDEHSFLVRIPRVGRDDKPYIKQVPFGKLRAGSPLRSCFASRSNCYGRDDSFFWFGLADKFDRGLVRAPACGPRRSSIPALSLTRQGRGTRQKLRFGTEGGATLAEFAFTLPILVLILYAIFDFGSALVLKQKLEHVVYEAARTAASQSTDDLSNTSVGSSGSVADLRDTVAQNLQNAGVNDCGLLGAAPTALPPPASTWTYSVSGGGCPAPLVLTIRREDVLPVGTVRVFMSRVTLQYPFQYRSTGILQAVAGSSTFPTSVNLVIDASMKNLL